MVPRGGDVAGNMVDVPKTKKKKNRLIYLTGPGDVDVKFEYEERFRCTRRPAAGTRFVRGTDPDRGWTNCPGPSYHSDPLEHSRAHIRRRSSITFVSPPPIR